MVGVASIVKTNTSTPILRLLSYLVMVRGVSQQLSRSAGQLIKFTC